MTEFKSKFFWLVLLVTLSTSQLFAQSNPKHEDPVIEDPAQQVQKAGYQAPECPSYGKNLEVNNAQVLHWKRTTPSGFRERGHVQGIVINIYNDKSGHDHFSIQIGRHQEDTLEIIYNQDFGSIPQIEVGMLVEACGDFITSTQQNGPYPPSPDGAILHWVHMNPQFRGHDPGFLMLAGGLYGQDTTNAGPKRERNQQQAKPNNNQNNGQNQRQNGQRRQSKKPPRKPWQQ